MAEIIAEPFVSFLVERLGDLLIQEAKFLHGVKIQVQQMQTELKCMQCFLKDADSRGGGGDKIVCNWVAEIEELSYNAEDIIATFVVKLSFMRRGVIHHVLKRYLCIFKADHGSSFRKVGSEIEAINTPITSLTRSLQTCGIQSIRLGESPTSRFERQRQLRRSYPHVVEEDIVGLEHDVKAVVDHLVNGKTYYGVVSIWGMGGLGKTTRAKMVYNHIDVRRLFG